MIAKLKEYDINKILPEINILIEKAETNDKFNIVKKMKEIVPEFISKNSVYEILDIN